VSEPSKPAESSNHNDDKMPGEVFWSLVSIAVGIVSLLIMIYLGETGVVEKDSELGCVLFMCSFFLIGCPVPVMMLMTDYGEAGDY